MRIAVVGAGMCGLVAARALVEAGAEVTVIDKGRGPGGRLATRRIADATLDHGAQFFTVRTPAFRRRVDDWTARGLVRVWSEGFGRPDGHARFVAVAGMNSLAKDLATGLDVRAPAMAFAVRSTRGATSEGCTVVIDDGTKITADAVVVTTPLPQAFALLADSDVELDESLMRTDYDRTLALLAVLDRSPDLPSPGGCQRPSDDVAFVADNAAKGVSARPALTLHASASWSERHWDDADVAEALAALAVPYLGRARVVEAQVKRWRFATPRQIWPDPCWRSADGRIVLAGDAFAGPRVEGAHNSGLAAAHALLG